VFENRVHQPGGCHAHLCLCGLHCGGWPAGYLQRAAFLWPLRAARATADRSARLGRRPSRRWLRRPRTVRWRSHRAGRGRARSGPPRTPSGSCWPTSPPPQTGPL